VVVLDRDLPAVHGDRVCRLLAGGGSPARVLMLTAAAGVADRVGGLELGAGDYLGKPFAFGELVANTLHATTAPAIAAGAQRSLARCLQAAQRGGGALAKCAAVYGSGARVGAAAQRAFSWPGGRAWPGRRRGDRGGPVPLPRQGRLVPGRGGLAGLACPVWQLMC
jgi:DNA-binding response OmpR family regulator